MVLLTRPLHRLAARPSFCSRAIFTATAAARPIPTWTTRSSAIRLQKLNSFGNARMLTGDKREKVKVLLVLYDGGKHAEDVCYIFTLPPLLDCGLAFQLLQLSIYHQDVLLTLLPIGSRASRYN